MPPGVDPSSDRLCVVVDVELERRQEDRRRAWCLTRRSASPARREELQEYRLEQGTRRDLISRRQPRDLLEENDHDLYSWVTGAAAAPLEFSGLISEIVAGLQIQTN